MEWEEGRGAHFDADGTLIGNNILSLYINAAISLFVVLYFMVDRLINFKIENTVQSKKLTPITVFDHSHH